MLPKNTEHCGKMSPAVSVDNSADMLSIFMRIIVKIVHLGENLIFFCDVLLKISHMVKISHFFEIFTKICDYHNNSLISNHRFLNLYIFICSGRYVPGDGMLSRITYPRIKSPACCVWRMAFNKVPTILSAYLFNTAQCRADLWTEHCSTPDIWYQKLEW